MRQKFSFAFSLARRDSFNAVSHHEGYSEPQLFPGVWGSLCTLSRAECLLYWSLCSVSWPHPPPDSIPCVVKSRTALTSSFSSHSFFYSVLTPSPHALCLHGEFHDPFVIFSKQVLYWPWACWSALGGWRASPCLTFCLGMWPVFPHNLCFLFLPSLTPSFSPLPPPYILLPSLLLLLPSPSSSYSYSMFFETGSHASQTDLEHTVYLRTILYFLCSCISTSWVMGL